MNEQLQLRLIQTRRSPADLAELCRFLKGRGWTKAAEISSHFGWLDRRIRALAASSEGEIISGQHGYRLTREANQAEYLHARDWLNRQANEMKRRVTEIDRVWHNRPAK